jgi:hypothetical protein
MTDHHDFGDPFHHDDPFHDDPFHDDSLSHDSLNHDSLNHEDQPYEPFDHQPADDHLNADDATPHHDDVPDEPAAHLDVTHPADAEAAVDHPGLGDDVPVDVFPPPVEVGELPEPVDGFPWVDSGSLGLADIQAALHAADTTDAVQPAELAEYAGADLPPGADPWATLADSDDPATAALAKWWSQN